MSLYNRIFETNPHAMELLDMLNLDPAKLGRFRDAWLSGKGNKIIVVTRNGGSNRPHFREVFDALKNHPYALRDWEDRDPTYAYIEFAVPTQYLDRCMNELATGVEPETVSEKFDRFLKDFAAHRDTPETRRAIKAGHDIMEQTNGFGGAGSYGLWDDDKPGPTSGDRQAKI